ncbi:dihydroorotate dehydrogenase [Paracoccus sediminicola]|uniref:dihydroorotate dehydrogenase n=1 Tax=Paracoccus sediminicola TaxID=3017783 RepID=UPI0022F0EB4E|nr:dihydroorotate dehydrogenase [Paracoccus sediminicola]WBU56120.1 dihydroorotate dehydrogenase [Paracoccus sediminicola]
MADLTTQLGTLRLRNPIMPASGTFTDELSQVFDLGLIGAHVTKTITAETRGGNPTPRVCEVAGGMLNSIGIPSKGVAHFVEKVIPEYRRWNVPLIVSISAGTADDFARLCAQVSQPGVAAIEVNISCPNIEEDGKAFAMRPETTTRAMEALRASSDLPLWAKLSPNTGQTVEVAQAAEAAGADALVVANTLLAMAIDVDSRKPRLGNLMGGLSGPSLKPITLRMAYQAARSVSIPVIGCGGISSLDDVLEYLIAGAAAVQVGTASFIEPAIMPRLVHELESWMDARGIASLDGLVGSVRDDEAPDAMIFAEAAP